MGEYGSGETLVSFDATSTHMHKLEVRYQELRLVL